jgi:pyruvate dehydrogenase E1 component beta subunit
LSHVINYSDALKEAFREEMRRDPSIFLLGEDIGLDGGVFAVTRGLMDEFGSSRVVDTPISEEGLVNIGLGAAITGCRPVVEIMFSSFMGITMEAVYNQISKIRYMSGGQAKVPFIIRTTNVLGRSSAAQHSGRTEAWFMHIPGLRVVAPSTPYDAKGMLKTALRGEDPVIFFEQAFLYFKFKGEVPDEDYTVPFGKACIRTTGSDVTLIAYSMMAQKALEAAEILAGKGIKAEVIDLRSLSPLDIPTVCESIRKTHRAVVCTDDEKTGGVAAEIVASIMENAFYDLDAPIARVAAPDIPVPYSPVMEQYIIPKAEDIVTAAEKVMNS